MYRKSALLLNTMMLHALVVKTQHRTDTANTQRSNRSRDYTRPFDETNESFIIPGVSA